MFDAAAQGRFALDAPPAPWVSLGWIKGFLRRSGSKGAAVLTGAPAAVLEQTRETLEAQVSLQFLSWTKLTMALSTGSQHMNLLAGTAVAVQAGSTGTFVSLAAADAAKFTAGQIVAVDVDNTGQTGFVGTPVSGAYVKSALPDVDYVRRVTFNVALVGQVSATGLTMAEALPGDAPAAGMKLQAVEGFVDREGGSFFQEWSGLFVMEGSQGERVFFHYPRLQAMGNAEEINSALGGKQNGTLERVLLGGQFRALPVVDALDGERVLCYRSFLPAANALV
jgi:hypothetical protein